jgi:NAD(P)-dependent dehydrogenase (short-subunit alcohol dehydrogenase family)
MAQNLRKVAGVLFAPPLHQKPEGPIDPSKVKLPSNFTVVIAGASRGIGLGIAKAYARASVSGLVLSSRSLDSLEQAAKEVIKINPKVKLMCQACDVTDEEQVKELVTATKTAFGRLDVLVINAGSATQISVKRENGFMDWPNNFLEQSPAEMEALWRLNVQAPFVLMHHFLPLLQDTEDGAKAVIHLSGAAAHYTSADIMAASYSLTKMAATRLVELCHEGHKSKGIVAFALQPGGVKTDMAATVPQGKGWEDRKCGILRRTSPYANNPPKA